MRKLLDSAWFYFALAGLAALVLVISQFRLDVPPKPKGTVDDLLTLGGRDDLNVVVIVIDTLRAEHMSAYGYERPTSPVMDSLAEQGFLFEHTESQSSWTKSSMASLWTGMYPQNTGISRYNKVLPPDAVMTAERFRDAGYVTAGLLRNGWVAINFGFAQGFDMYVKPQPNLDIERIRRKPPGSKALQGSDIDITESALQFIQNNHTDRFFLYIHYMDVHQYTYNAASDLFGTTYLDAYDNAIHWTDSNVGMVIDTLRYLALLDNTLVVIASDHGESFLEHGNEGHAKNLYHEVQRVPLIIVPPFVLPEPVVVRGQVGNIDIAPTLLDLLGLPPLPNADGISLIPHMIAAGKGEPEPHPDRIVISQLDRWWGKPKKDPLPIVAVVRQPYRLHQRRGNINQVELFDHRDDPNEEEDISRREPEIVAELLAAADDLLENGEPRWGEPEEIELDSMMLHQLRALGYAVEEN